MYFVQLQIASVFRISIHWYKSNAMKLYPSSTGQYWTSIKDMAQRSFLQRYWKLNPEDFNLEGAINLIL